MESDPVDKYQAEFDQLDEEERAQQAAEDARGGSVILSSLQWWTTDSDIQDLCAVYGKVKAVEFVTDPKNGKSTGVCTLDFESAAAAIRARDALHGREFDGKTCDAKLKLAAAPAVVDAAPPPPPKAPSPPVRQHGGPIRGKGQNQGYHQHQQHHPYAKGGGKKGDQWGGKGKGKGQRGSTGGWGNNNWNGNNWDRGGYPQQGGNWGGGNWW
eukprot:TRINITY_DN12739_c0_g1_i1.p1 TRINITY_DN12739_c0_g1~~TRINITY_DN12739_c0_g1_i1.p1  ORF type:complete len:212 (-),score=37.18 TRINITY_DN12739_c0_g1_i1:231-866(-)